MKNYRPVSNLSFLSQLLEGVVKKRLQEFLDSKKLMPMTQTAYRQYRSTQTAVMKVCIDLYLAANEGDVSALHCPSVPKTLRQCPDTSAAFLCCRSVLLPRCPYTTPQYLVDCCKSTTDAVSRQRLRSENRPQLIVPRHRRTSFGRRGYTVADPTAWN